MLGSLQDPWIIGVKGSPERVYVTPGCGRGGDLDRNLVVMRRRRRRRPLGIPRKYKENNRFFAMGSRQFTRTCPGYGSAQNFAGYFAGLVKSFFDDFNYTNPRNN